MAILGPGFRFLFSLMQEDVHNRGPDVVKPFCSEQNKRVRDHVTIKPPYRT